MRRDDRALEEKYNEQNPVAVATATRSGARDLADTLAGFDDKAWQRIGIYPWPESVIRTVEWIGRRTAHELAHHLFDCHRLLGPRRWRGRCRYGSIGGFGWRGDDEVDDDLPVALLPGTSAGVIVKGV